MSDEVRLVGETRNRPDGDVEFVVVASPNVASLIQAAMKGHGTTFPEWMIATINTSLRELRPATTRTSTRPACTTRERDRNEPQTARGVPERTEGSAVEGEQPGAPSVIRAGGRSASTGASRRQPSTLPRRTVRRSAGG